MRQIAYANALLDSTTDAVVGFDLDGRVQSWNPAAERLLQWAARDAIGRTADELFTVELPGHFGKILDSAAAGRLVRGDCVLRRRDGSTIEVDVRANAIRDTDRTIVGVVAQLADVTVERNEQRALRETAELLDNADAFIRADVDGTITHWSAGAERIFGWTAAMMVGQPWTTLYADAADLPHHSSSVLVRHVLATRAGPWRVSPVIVGNSGRLDSPL